MGDALKDYYDTSGPEKVPITVFSYWNLIDEILSQRHRDPIVAEAVRAGEQVLQKESKATLSSVLEEEKPVLEEDLMSFDSSDESHHALDIKFTSKTKGALTKPLDLKSPKRDTKRRKTLIRQAKARH